LGDVKIIDNIKEDLIVKVFKYIEMQFSSFIYLLYI
jgi:hypothetical protein